MQKSTIKTIATVAAATAIIAASTTSAKAEEVTPVTTPGSDVEENTVVKTQEELLNEEKAEKTTRLNDVNTEIETLENSEELKQAEELEAKDKALTKEIKALKKEQSDLTKEQGTLTESIDKLTEEKSTLTETIEGLIAKQNDPQVKVLIEENAALTEESSTVNAEKTTEEKALEKINTNISNLTSEKTELSTDIKALEKQETLTNELITKTQENAQKKIDSLTAEIDKLGGTSTENTITTVFSNDTAAYHEKHNPHNMEILKHNGSTEIKIDLTEEQIKEFETTGGFSYTPNVREVNKHVIAYLNELRALNGISDRVTFSEESFNMALKRAEEMFRTNKLSHDVVRLSNGEITSENILYNPYASNSKRVRVYGEANKGYAILSDQQLAYFMIYNWFSDYTNVKPGDYGHRENLFGNFKHFGIAIAGDQDEFYGAMVTTDEPFRSRHTFGMSADGKSFLMNGKEMKFLPRTTFTYQINKSGTTADQEARRQKLINERTQLEKTTREKVQTLRGQLTTIQNNLTETRQEFDTVSDKLAEEMTKVQPRQDKINELTQKLTDITNRQQEIKEELKAFDIDTNDLINKQNRLNNINEELSEKETRLDVVNDRLAVLPTEITEKETEQTDVKSKLTDIQDKVMEVKDKIVVLQGERTELINRLNVIENLLKPFRPIVDVDTPRDTKNPTDTIVVETTDTKGKTEETVNVSTSVTNETAKTTALPKTGDDSTAMAAMFGFLSVALGFGLLKKKEDN